MLKPNLAISKKLYSTLSLRQVSRRVDNLSYVRFRVENPGAVPASPDKGYLLVRVVGGREGGGEGDEGDAGGYCARPVIFA